MDRLTKDLERVTEEAAVYEAQGAAQKRETQAVSETLSEVGHATHESLLHTHPGSAGVETPWDVQISWPIGA